MSTAVALFEEMIQIGAQLGGRGGKRDIAYAPRDFCDDRVTCLTKKKCAPTSMPDVPNDPLDVLPIWESPRTWAPKRSIYVCMATRVARRERGERVLRDQHMVVLTDFL